MNPPEKAEHGRAQDFAYLRTPQRQGKATLATGARLPGTASSLVRPLGFQLAQLLHHLLVG
jgi:hypothetical protein